MISFCYIFWWGVFGEILGASCGAILQAIFGMINGLVAGSLLVCLEQVLAWSF